MLRSSSLFLSLSLSPGASPVFSTAKKIYIFLFRLISQSLRTVRPQPKYNLAGGAPTAPKVPSKSTGASGEVRLDPKII